MNTYGYIYKIENKINGKIYIGQTINGFKTRYWGGDICKYTHNEHLRNSIEKYGIDNFEINEEFAIAHSKDELDQLEKKYIAEYRTTDPKFGYNKKEGGSNGRVNEESKMKMHLSSFKNYNIFQWGQYVGTVNGNQKSLYESLGVDICIIRLMIAYGKELVHYKTGYGISLEDNYDDCEPFLYLATKKDLEDDFFECVNSIDKFEIIDENVPNTGCSLILSLI